MNKVILYTILLIIGLVGSQFLASSLGDSYETIAYLIRILSMVALAYIMIHVGFEFEIDKSNLRQYGWDYVVAMTAAAFPWIFVALYFVFVMLPSETWGSLQAWKESLLSSRFAAPTSAGVLFSMLAAAGLSATWLFKKARILAIFDDLDTVLLMIPLKMLMVGLAWQLGIIVIVMFALLWVAWKWLHKIPLPVTWNWVMIYSVIITIICEIIYKSSKLIDDTVPIHIEILLPAFVLGCVLKIPENKDTGNEANDGHHSILETPTEQRVSTIVSAVFMVLVGLSLPYLFGDTTASEPSQTVAVSPEVANVESEMVSSKQPMPPWSTIAWHVLAVTVLSNLGKMFPAFCYRKEAHWRERLAVAIGMWPRGEVGAGVLLISLSYGIQGPIVIVAMFSLAINLLLTGFFIMIVKKLVTFDRKETT